MKRNDKELLTRVPEMEQAYDRVLDAVSRIRKELELLQGLDDDIRKLEDYSSSGLWMKDFEADEAGLIPKEVKRGVLSEDGLYNLLSDVSSLKELF